VLCLFLFKSPKCRFSVTENLHKAQTVAWWKAAVESHSRDSIDLMLELKIKRFGANKIDRNWLNRRSYILQRVTHTPCCLIIVSKTAVITDILVHVHAATEYSRGTAPRQQITMKHAHVASTTPHVINTYTVIPPPIAVKLCNIIESGLNFII